MNVKEYREKFRENLNIKPPSSQSEQNELIANELLTYLLRNDNGKGISKAEIRSFILKKLNIKRFDMYTILDRLTYDCPIFDGYGVIGLAMSEPEFHSLRVKLQIE